MRFFRPAGLLGLAFFATLPAIASPAAAAEPKPESTEFRVFRGDKDVGKEVLRKQTGKEGVYFSIHASLQDKVTKVWRTFTQRAHLPLLLNGEFTRYDRWIDVTGATSEAKLIQFQGGWRVVTREAAKDGVLPKPKVTEVKVAKPLVVFDERLPSLVAVAAERMTGRTAADYVRVDDGTFGKVAISYENLVDKAGTRFTRTRMTAPGVDVAVLNDDKGRTVHVQGLDGWSGLVVGAKIPKDLKAVASAAPEAPLPAAATPGAP